MSICVWSSGCQGKDKSSGSAFGVARIVLIKSGRRAEGVGCRVSAEYAVVKSFIWREAVNRDFRRSVAWAEWGCVGVNCKARWAKWTTWVWKGGLEVANRSTTCV